MKTNEQPAGPNASGRMVLAFVAFILVVIFIGSFVYRMRQPSLEVHRRQAPEGQGGMPEGMGQAMNGPMKEVLELMQKLQANPNDPALQLAMAERFMAMGSFDRAKTFLDKVIKQRPEDPEVLNDMGVTLYNLKDTAGAETAFKGVLAHDAANYRAHFNLGLLYKYALNQPEKATESFKSALASPDIDPDTRKTAQKELG